MENLSTYITIAIILAITITTIISSIVVTPQNHYSFITLFGKYQKTVAGGLSFKIPFVSSVDKRVFLGLSSRNLPLTLKTSDQVTFNLSLNIQYVVSDNPSEAFKALYNIFNFKAEMDNVATNSAIPLANNIEIEDVYNKKEDITDRVKEDLSIFFKDYGIDIKFVLSDEPKLPNSLEQQANDVMKAKRDKDAAKHIAEKIRIEKVGVANADGQSVKIRMQNISDSRLDYAKKSAESVKVLVESGCSPDAALSFLNQVGEQDAIVSASRNNATLVFHTSNKGDNSSADALLAKSLIDKKEKSDS